MKLAGSISNMNIRRHLEQEITRVMHEVGAPADSRANVQQARLSKFGQYQANGIMSTAKSMSCNPRELAEKVVRKLDLKEASKVETAGPGFINIHLNSGFIAQKLEDLQTDERLGVPLSASSEVIVVDYSAPNLMKEMHVGHLRSTSIGDAIVRLLEFLGHDVLRTNHVGDWGAQFGSLLAYMDQVSSDEDLSTELADLEVFYQAASSLFKNDAGFARRARAYVVALQSGDKKCLRLWEKFVEESFSHCQRIYDELNITLNRDHIKGESFYNEYLTTVVDELEEKGLLTESDGAKCVFLPEFKGKDDKPLPAIVQKSDGGFPYMATDIAAVRYRATILNVDKALYFVGAPQLLHLELLFAVCKAAGYIREHQVFRHLPNGSIMGKNGKPFASRSGTAVKLADVLAEAKSRAGSLVNEKSGAMDEASRKRVAEVVAISAVKYAELSKNRTTDYIFDWDQMLSFEGNTAPYLLYAYTRIRSIFRRADADDLGSEIIIKEPDEINLATKILQFPEAVDSVMEDFCPNLMCNYLFELAGLFMTFYESCPVLKSDEPIKSSRLQLCDLTGRTLKLGLALLGIETVERM